MCAFYRPRAWRELLHQSLLGNESYDIGLAAAKIEWESRVCRMSEGNLTRITDINLCDDLKCKWYTRNHQVMTTFNTITCLSRNLTFTILICTHTKLKSMNIFYAECVSTWLENQEIIFCIWDIVLSLIKNIPVFSVRNDTAHTH